MSSAFFREPPNSTSEPSAPPLESDTNCEPSPTSKKSRSRKKSYLQDSATVLLIEPQSSRILQLSMAEGYETVRRLVSPDSPASHSAKLVSDLEKTTNGIYSERSSEWLMSLHLDSCSLKTCLGCSAQWLTRQTGLFNQHQSETWLDSFPKLAFVAGGYLWEQKMSVLPTAGSDGGALRGGNWHTPFGQGNVDSKGKVNGGGELDMQVKSWCTPSAENFRTRGGDRADEMGLDNQAKAWASPRAEDGECAGARISRGVVDTLNAQVRQEQNWPTPTDQDCKNDGGISQFERNSVPLNSAVKTGPKQQLNPDWEEILMGWPIGWTEPLQFAPKRWPGFPMGQGAKQFDYEPARTIPKGTCPNRVSRVKACGNGVVPQTAEVAFYFLLQ